MISWIQYTDNTGNFLEDIVAPHLPVFQCIKERVDSPATLFVPNGTFPMFSLSLIEHHMHHLGRKGTTPDWASNQ